MRCSAACANALSQAHSFSLHSLRLIVATPLYRNVLIDSKAIRKAWPQHSTEDSPDFVGIFPRTEMTKLSDIGLFVAIIER